MAATLSTILKTKNELSIQFVAAKPKTFSLYPFDFFSAGNELYYQLKYPFNFKQGIEICVEEGTSSTNAKTKSSSTHLELVSSSSGLFITS